ncbi:hypothetical protein Pla110_00720 [Polystyrenella longa]|uniref:DUF6896 domain-containing protein n=1 Tax=Polystyrenella longa TaxID=2528007 RepID=A0A518CGL8_9PLAN|nr:hypothetical protein [Polystyrenella longa]QDU78371.1 hypothetical protein Pla110_00720 [Polystyrenella longa]
MTTTLDIIEHYLSGVRDNVNAICDHYGVDDLWLNQEDRIPCSAIIDCPAKRIRFSFHGVGCRMQVGNQIYDFDFGPDGRIDGFDAFRLSLYIQSRNKNDEKKFTEEQLQTDIDSLVTKGGAIKPKWEPGPHLYYLVENNTSPAANNRETT